MERCKVTLEALEEQKWFVLDMIKIQVNVRNEVYYCQDDDVTLAFVK